MWVSFVSFCFWKRRRSREVSVRTSCSRIHSPWLGSEDDSKCRLWKIFPSPVGQPCARWRGRRNPLGRGRGASGTREDGRVWYNWKWRRVKTSSLVTNFPSPVGQPCARWRGRRSRVGRGRGASGTREDGRASHNAPPCRSEPLPPAASKQERLHSQLDFRVTRGIYCTMYILYSVHHSKNIKREEGIK